MRFSAGTCHRTTGRPRAVSALHCRRRLPTVDCIVLSAAVTHCSYNRPQRPKGTRMSDAILFEMATPAIAVITINRPEQRNAINTAVRQGLFAAFERIENERSIRAAILTGAGDKAF